MIAALAVAKDQRKALNSARRVPLHGYADPVTGSTAAAPPPPSPPPSKPPKRKQGVLRKVVISVAIVVVLLVVLYSVMLTFVARSYRVPSEAMAPTLNVGDHFIVNKLTYRFSSPQPGDVIVFKGPPAWNVGYKSIRSSNAAMRWLQNALSVVGLAPPDENDLVKRIIAVGGQTVECRSTTGLTVDGKPLTEPFLNTKTMGVENRPGRLPVPRAGVRPRDRAGRPAVGDGRQPHALGGFACALHQRPGRLAAWNPVHRRPDVGHYSGRKRHREGAAVLIHNR